MLTENYFKLKGYVIAATSSTAGAVYTFPTPIVDINGSNIYSAFNSTATANIYNTMLAKWTAGAALSGLATSPNGSPYICLGTNGGTIERDISSLTNMIAVLATTTTSDDNTQIFSTNYTLPEGSETITLREIGFAPYIPLSSGSRILVVREVLETPIVIEAGQTLALSVKFNMSND